MPARRERNHVHDRVGRADSARHVVTALSGEPAVVGPTASDPPTPCRRCACRSSPPSAHDANPQRNRREAGQREAGASAALVMVDGAHVMQCPGERAMPPSMPCQSSCVIVSARSSDQYFHTSEPEPSVTPFQLPRSIGPAGRKIAGRSIESRPSAARAWSCRSRPSARRHRRMERSVSSASIARNCGTASWWASGTARRGSEPAVRPESRRLARCRPPLRRAA